jgi:cofilin
MSGVLPTDACKAEFAILKNKRAYKFITFKIDPVAGTTDVLEIHKKEVRLRFF